MTTLQLPVTGTVSGLMMAQDANTALAALAVANQGATAPTTAGTGLTSTAGVLWHDTANNLLKLRDQADANWIVIAALDETNKTYVPAGYSVTLASAATVNIGAAAAAYIKITGTTAITAFDTAQAGTHRLIEFTGALTLANNSTSLILPRGANIITAAGDVALMVSEGSGNWRCASYLVASGAITGGTISGATLSGCTLSGTTSLPGFGSISSGGVLNLGLSGNALNIASAFFKLTPNQALVSVENETGTAAQFMNNSSVGASVEIRSDATEVYMIAFNNSGSLIGSVSTGVSSVAYNTTSDYRVKENISLLSGALDMIAKMKPSTFTYKKDPLKQIHTGFIAHELQTVLPEAVHGEKDAIGKDGNMMMQGVDYGKLTPVLVAAVQELAAEIAALKAQIMRP